MTTAYAELIERLEKTSVPDREIDAELWLAFTPGATRKTTHIDHWQRPYDIDETRDGTGRLITVPQYTDSLDAAVALMGRVLPGTEWAISTLYGRNHAEVDMNAEEPVTAQGATPAIALCIAAIRAHGNSLSRERAAE